MTLLRYGDEAMTHVEYRLNMFLLRDRIKHGFYYADDISMWQQQQQHNTLPIHNKLSRGGSFQWNISTS